MEDARFDSVHLGHLPPPEPSPDDFAAAKAAIERLLNCPPSDSEDYKHRLHLEACERANVGAWTYDLLHGLREPIRPLDEQLVALVSGRITNEEYQAACYGPPAMVMFEAVSDAVFHELAQYGKMQSAVAELALHPHTAKCTEADVDRLCEDIVSPSTKPFLRDEMVQVEQFLQKMRGPRAGAVRCGNLAGTTAHALVIEAVCYWAGAWFAVKRQLRERREHTGQLNVRSAAQYVYENDKRPNSRELEALLLQERREAEGALEVDGPWSNPDGPGQWAKKFGCSWDTLKRRFDDGRIRYKKITSKSYKIHVDDLPNSPAN